MDYAYYRVNDAADAVQRELAQLELRIRSGVSAEEIIGKPSTWYIERHPDVEYLKDSTKLQGEVIKRLKKAVRSLREAAIYAERVEWLTSGDDGYEAFCLSLDEDLAECKRKGGVR